MNILEYNVTSKDATGLRVWPNWWGSLIEQSTEQMGGIIPWVSTGGKMKIDAINDILKPYNGKFYIDNEIRRIVFETEQDKMFFLLKYS